MSTAFPHGPRCSSNWFSGFESLVMAASQSTAQLLSLLPKAGLCSSACGPRAAVGGGSQGPAWAQPCLWDCPAQGGGGWWEEEARLSQG